MVMTEQDEDRVGTQTGVVAESVTACQVQESVCCQEMDELGWMLHAFLGCVTEHEDFAPLCLNRAVLHSCGSHD